MLITQRVAAEALKKAHGLSIADLCIGVGYTGVKLSNGAGGTCFTFRHELGLKCGPIQGAGTMIGMPAAVAVEMAMSTNLAEASIGVAAINAILNDNFDAGKDAVDVMDIREPDTVGMIGYFYPVVKQIKDTVDKLYIFERNITEEGLLPDWCENIYLPECDVVLITGVTFINKTIDHVLSLCRNAKEVVIMGASTCMAPDVLKDYGVTILAGSRVTDPDKLLRVIAQGGGGLDVQNYTQKLCMRITERRR
ncbi:MAG: DUF364 domain-containing protein [Syntrophaceticus sp.]|nr:DUF364 domain-containing protein [Syntrophaceticus sp.]MDD3315005.1 DUF364 domain-containing protein [Syntrophaceticus sp.]MDD4360195.1 DUF364 domain-containing protein [Syntrophaceticus sp.]MDD4783376.1 DUF364 domain-containing protein [Syntrophaceticus sp.]